MATAFTRDNFFGVPTNGDNPGENEIPVAETPTEVVTGTPATPIVLSQASRSIPTGVRAKL
jgi:hypothetical protein